MAEKRGAHQRPANQQSANRQGANQRPSNMQSGQQRQATARDPRAQQYGRPANQQAADQRATSNKAAYKRSGAQTPVPGNPGNTQVYTFDDDYYKQYDLDQWNVGKQKKRKKGHALRNTLIVILVVVLIVGGFGAFTGYTLYESAKVVRSDASSVMSDINTLTDKLLIQRMFMADKSICNNS